MKKNTMHVVSATHWDREWIVPFEAYRAKFINYTDELIRIMESDPDFKHYQMDGQVICMEDYLTIRPEQTQKVRELVRAGRLMLGPWYTLPDMNLTCGESIVRNLLVGIQAANDLGGAMMEGYTACSNGQIAQLPQIYRGFGINSAVIYKGIWWDRFPREIIWRAPDGSEVLTLCLSTRHGRCEFYTLLFHEVICNVIHDDPTRDTWRYTISEDKARNGELLFRLDGRRFHPPLNYKCLKPYEGYFPEYLKPYLTKLREYAADKSASTQWIVFQGMDHTPPYASTPKLIAAADKCFDDMAVVDSSLPEALAALRDNIDLSKLLVYEGELRDVRRKSPDRNTNIATLSTRLDVKIINRETEHALIDRTEPLCAWAWLIGGCEHPASLLQHAWKLMLANHGHDSIDSCSMDKVNSDVITRFADCMTLCEQLTEQMLGVIIQKVSGEQPATPLQPESLPFVSVFNPSLTPLGGLCEMIVDIPETDESEGEVVLVAEDGQDVPLQINSSHNCDINVESTVGGRPLALTRYNILFDPGTVPAMGWSNFGVMRKTAVSSSPISISAEDRVLENEYLRVEILDDGRLNILCKQTGWLQEGMHYFIDRADIGDPWNFKPVNDTPITSINVPASIELIENGPLRGSYRVRTVLNIPASGMSLVEGNEVEIKPLAITSILSLSYSAKRLEIETTIENASKYHKLVVCFPTGMTCEKTYAGGQYMVTERPVALPDMTGWEEPITAYPNYGFAGVSNSESGLSLLNMGLPEYFVEAGENGHVMTLTLLRATQLEYGWPKEHPSVEQGHMLGVVTSRYAIYPHVGGWYEAGLWGAYSEFALPPICTQYFGRAIPGCKKGLMCLESESLQTSCVKKSEEGCGLVVRFWNPSNETQNGVLRFAMPVKDASCVNFNEEPVADDEIGLNIKDEGYSVFFRIAAHKVVTIKLNMNFICQGNII